MQDCLTLKKSNCKNCYKCIRNCPVKSIKFTANQAHILSSDCILCGHCFVVCPQNAKQIASSLNEVKSLIKEGARVYASLAPSFIANYDGFGLKSLEKALLKLGFTAVEETAIGATIVKNEYERILTNAQNDVYISSCCHSVNLLIQKYFPNLLPNLLQVVSPMQAHALHIKERDPLAKVVFIGPCVAKKDEGKMYKGVVDEVLTFEELTEWLNDEEIKLEKIIDDNEYSKARLFPVAGGIIKTMSHKPLGYSYLAIDGINNCIAALKDIANGKIEHCFIEMNACSGGCIGGPVMEKYHRQPIHDYLAVEHYAGKKDFIVANLDEELTKKVFSPLKQNDEMPSEEEIKKILAEMGKKSKEQELNCGSCGYDSCRDKAIAISKGKANISMCLPYLMSKTLSFSDVITNNSPNGIIVLNSDFEIQQINKAARKLLCINDVGNLLGENVTTILDLAPFKEVLDSGHNIHDRKMYLSNYNCYVEETIVFDQTSHYLVAIMRDISSLESEKRKKEQMAAQTLEVADKVVDKQMRIVQEIASLLGETAAETKIALTKLKENIRNE